MPIHIAHIGGQLCKHMASLYKHMVNTSECHKYNSEVFSVLYVHHALRAHEELWPQVVPSAPIIIALMNVMCDCYSGASCVCCWYWQLFYRR